MARSYAVAALLCALALPLALDGCAGVLVVGGLAAAAGGGYAAGQERGVGGAVDDFTIKHDVDRAMLRANPQLQEVASTVYEGRVLLTGQVPNETLRSTAEQAAGATPNVRAVYNELEVANAGGMWDDAQDAWITTRVRSEMVLDPDIKSINYDIDTANGSVYLIGSARSQRELERATRIARYVPGVRRVVSYVEVRSGAPIAAGGPPRAIERPRAAPRTPIEVQKL
ncbi:MAG: BON domain-containing protein [Thiohalocapsa sp.]